MQSGTGTDRITILDIPCLQQDAVDESVLDSRQGIFHGDDGVQSSAVSCSVDAGSMHAQVLEPLSAFSGTETIETKGSSGNASKCSSPASSNCNHLASSPSLLEGECLDAAAIDVRAEIKVYSSNETINANVNGMLERAIAKQELHPLRPKTVQEILSHPPRPWKAGAVSRSDPGLSMEQYPSAIAHLRRAHALVTERRLATLCSGVETQSFDNMANKGLQDYHESYEQVYRTHHWKPARRSTIMRRVNNACAEDHTWAQRQVAPKMEKAQKEPKVPAWMRLSAPKPPPQPAPAPGPGTPATARRHVLAWGNARAVQNKQADALPRLAAIRQQGSQKPGQQQPCDARLVAGSAHLLARTQQDEVPMQPHVQVQLRAPRLTRKTLCLSGLGGTLLEATVEGSGEEGTDTGSLGCPDAEHAAKTRTSGNRPGWLAGLQAALKHALVTPESSNPYLAQYQQHQRQSMAAAATPGFKRRSCLARPSLLPPL